MGVEIKRDCLILIPESPQDDSFIEDTMGIKTGEEVSVERIHDVKMGFKNDDSWVLKIKKNKVLN